MIVVRANQWRIAHAESPPGWRILEKRERRTRQHWLHFAAADLWESLADPAKGSHACQLSLFGRLP